MLFRKRSDLWNQTQREYDEEQRAKKESSSSGRTTGFRFKKKKGAKSKGLKRRQRSYGYSMFRELW